MQILLVFIFSSTLIASIYIFTSSKNYKSKKRLLAFNFNKNHRNLLQLYIPFYVTLNNTEKSVFESRLKIFIEKKQFIGMNGINASDEMAILISAIIVKMTFYFDEFSLPHFNKILIYPDSYLSQLTNQYHKGDVDLKGSIRLAWTHFSNGIIDMNDGINLAVHEFAHAIFFENKIKNKEHGFIDVDALNKWTYYAEREMLLMRRTNEHFLRDYASTNLDEFFAVSSEHFFEQAHSFAQQKPTLYNLLQNIYKQDPRKYSKQNN